MFQIHSLRNRLIVTSLIVVALPIIIVAAVLEREGRDAVLAEKQKKLLTLTRVLDIELGAGYEPLLADLPGGWTDRDAALRRLSERLTPITDRVAATDPGVGVGYYSLRLDAIVTYGPSAEYGAFVGQAIRPDHPGRRVMATDTASVEIGTLVRGPIMNAMLPLKRNGEVVGYAWANETVEAIGDQHRGLDLAVGLTALFGIFGAFALVWVTTRRLSQEVDAVVDGLEAMKVDLHRPIPPLRGELGDIVVAINAMAKALLDARSLTENILSSIADGIVAVDCEGRVTAINPAAEAFYETSAAVAIGRPYADLFAGDAAHSALLETLGSGRTHIGVPIELARGERRLKLDVSSSVLRDGDDNRIGAVVVLKDVSERDRLLVQVMRADRLAGLGELTAGIAHEIRNPLTSIRGFLQYLQECETPEEWRRFGPVIIREVDSLNHIIGELLAFGRPRPPEIGRVAMNGLVEEMAFLARGKSDARIELSLADDLPTIDGDREALKQAILNLLINAIQAGPKNGRVEISTAVEDECVVIRVHDDGVGIPPENLGKIFDPFFSTKATGTGLGLAMVHRIIDAHTGVITVDSTPGEGTVAEVRLPLRRPAPETEE